MIYTDDTSLTHSTRPFKSSAGFSLVELLVTLSIIALLFSVMLPTLRGVRGVAEKLMSGISDVQRVETATDIPNTLRIFPRDGRTIVGSVSQLVRERNLHVEQMRVEQGRLDEVFRRVTAIGSGHNKPGHSVEH